MQDTETEAWARVLENIDSARRTGASRLVPLEGLSWEQRSQIVTLPASIASLSEVKSIHLYRSNLVRLPPEIGEMPSLACLDVYTSYRLHFAPLELVHACSEACLDRLPTPNRAYVDHPHEGGAQGQYSPPKR